MKFGPGIIKSCAKECSLVKFLCIFFFNFELINDAVSDLFMVTFISEKFEGDVKFAPKYT